LSEQDRQRLEIGAAHRVLGQVHEALGDRAEADAAFQRSIEVLEEIQSRPELAQTLLAYGRFRRGDHPLEDRAMIERALALFEAMGATGWIEEARGARFPIARSGRPPVTLNGIWGGGFHGID
jgi:tetratricopeptide (TPR) repeat protein